ncbi:UDP-N-acetylglucosamine--N-acetylmuramyl-(pentapeptide) pyrophosphoryl-undecaprenol N-acetylglucosamine transferase MurG [Phycisphaerae bacterium RAS1]|nr:UDP-N-acetylglucosamine--N-acetylmuramyl-(pentapeptide) pyrophosphoryl-undecaprenol N-acetylglucosamine transferase MurG [Phycisphaerae bacterium RAS1]
MPAPRFVFAGGGTGGHLYPGLAVADALRRLQPDADITFFTTDRALDRELLGKTTYHQAPQPVRPFSSRPWHWPAFWLAWSKSVSAARRAFQEHRPAAVLGLGGYAAGPPVVAARKLGIRTAILNPDAIPGRANRFLARYCDRVFMQWEASRRNFPAGAPCVACGCPIRSTFATADRAAGRAFFKLDADRPLLLVTGASQGARTVNEAALAGWPDFFREHPEWQLLHLSGVGNDEALREGYRRCGAAAQVLAFTHEMHLAIAAADLVVSRAGASTLAELTAIGRPSILLPYPYHRDRHQHANARVLSDAGAAILLEDWKDAARNRGPLLEALRRAAGAERRTTMASAAAKLGRPTAADEVARWMGA